MTDFPTPLLLGHRGAGGEAPENTWPAFEKAKAAGMHGFEVDVMLTRDGAPVVVHDMTLHRIAGGRGAVKSMTLAALERLDVGSHFHPRFAGERIPRLEEVLDYYGKDMILDVELKGPNPFCEGIEKVVVALIRERGLIDSVIISSFNPVILKRVAALEPRIRMGSNYISDPILLLRRIWFAPFLKPYSKHPQPYQVDEEYMARQRKRGIKVMPWGVNGEEEMKRMLGLGVEGIITDHPAKLREIVDNGKAPA